MSAATDLSTADVLRAAKQVLIERGWTQGKYVDDFGCVCSFGAINVAVTGDPRQSGSYRSSEEQAATEASRLVSKAVDRELLDIWNDAVGRTKDDVLAAFDKAIALAEAEASR